MVDVDARTEPDCSFFARKKPVYGAFTVTRLTFIVFLLVVLATPSHALDFFVSPNGNDANPGTEQKPFATPARAQNAARRARQTPAEPITVHFRGGTYYLDEPLIFTADDSASRNAPLAFATWQDEKPVFSGGLELNLKWKPFRDQILQAKTPAGLRKDDVIVEYDGKPIKQITDLLSSQGITGKTISVTVYRSQNRVTMKLLPAK